MTDQRHTGELMLPSERAFTLVEIVVALTIMAIITAVAIPTLKGLNFSEKARQPVDKLANLVQEARHRAMRERRSYQIVFEPGGIHASPAMYPYEKVEDFLKELEAMRTPLPETEIQRSEIEQEKVEGRADRSFTGSQTAKPEPPWTVSVPLEEGTRCEVLMWGDGEWDVLDGGRMRRWVFQPVGMCNPAQIRLRNEGAELEAEFDALTGELTMEQTKLVKRP